MTCDHGGAPYWLFSQTKMHGSFHNAAMFLGGTGSQRGVRGEASEGDSLGLREAARSPGEQGGSLGWHGLQPWVARAAALGSTGCSLGLHRVARGAAHIAS